MKQIDASVIDPKYLGVPYVLFGKTLAGADCIGMAIMWLAEQGIQEVYDDNTGPMMAHWWENNPRRFLDAFLARGSVVRFQQLKKYDCLLLIGDEQGTFPSCLGIMIDDRHFLTATLKRGSFVAMLDEHWKGKFWSGIRLKSVIERFGP